MIIIIIKKAAPGREKRRGVSKELVDRCWSRVPISWLARTVDNRTE